MFETFRSFSDYVQEYELERAEGLLLRHLNSAYKVLSQTVPDGAKTGEILEMELYLREMLRQVDSSLLDEWEKMRDAAYRPRADEELRPPRPEEPFDVTLDRKAFLAAVRARIFTFLRAWWNKEIEQALDALDDDADTEGRAWTFERLAFAREAFEKDHGSLRLDPEARNLKHTHVTEADGSALRIQQMLVDAEGLNDWVAEVEVDLEGSRKAEEPILRLLRLESYT
jgi:hypothetical protein